MAVLVGYGDRLVRSDGTPSDLSRSSVPLDMFADGGGVRLVGGDNAVTSYENVYSSQSLVFKSVNKIARILATLPLKVYERDGNGDKRRVQTGPLADLLRSPWPRAGALDLQEAIGLSVLVYGNALLYKGRPARGAAPDALIPLDWRYVKPRSFSPGGPVEYWETGQTGEVVILMPEDVVHVAWRAPGRSVGISPLLPLATALALEDAARRFSIASFTNAARPGAAYILPQDSRYTTADRAELKAGLNATHAGVDNAFKTAIVSGGGQFVPLSHNAQESELVALRQRNQEEVGSAYDLPGPLIGDLTHGTYSNVQELHRMLYETILLPWTVLLEQKLWAQLVNREQEFAGQFAEFDFSERLRGDRQRELEVLTAAAGGPIMLRNEARRVLNLPKVEDPEADKLLTATNNMTPAGTPPKAVVRHMERAADRLRRKGDADLDRFERELSADLDDPVAAAEWKSRLADAIPALAAT